MRNPRHNPYLVCAVHFDGVEGESCLDFREDPNAEPVELWEPEGATYYNGELILQPRQHWTREQQMELIDWHPMFTGKCPRELCGFVRFGKQDAIAKIKSN
ncbi:hypothetical protein LC609_37545 [Nostoc sp. XA013]|nr:hypothetical protein [Nostoc sp. XA013]